MKEMGDGERILDWCFRVRVAGARTRVERVGMGMGLGWDMVLGCVHVLIGRYKGIG